MSHKKLHLFRNITLPAAIVGCAVLALATVVLSSHKASAYHATECSDVYTSLSTFVTDGVAANKSFYVRAMNETGVPWEMLAAIHYRETGFSHTNPSNGQGIFQFVNGDGGPYPPGPVSDDNFYAQLRYMANRLQSDYVFRNSPNPANVQTRKLTANEQDINLIKNTLYSYNGRSSEYAAEATHFGFSQPYEGSPYVMNRFDCYRARMGIITQDYGSIDSTDTRYGAFTIFARLRGDDYWKLLTVPYSWSLVSQEAYYDSGRTTPADTAMLAPKQLVYLSIKARNMGNTAWTNDGSSPVVLGTSSPGNHDSVLCDTASWLACSRPAALKETTVDPGQIGTFEFAVKMPSTYGSYKEYYNALSEGKAWMNDLGLYWSFEVKPPTSVWQVANQSIFTDSARILAANPGILSPNATYYLRINVLNKGNTVWSNSGPNPVVLGTMSPQDRMSAFCDSSWISCNRAASLKEASVAPGQFGTFEFSVKTPNTLGDFKEYFRPLQEGIAWMNDVGMYMPFGLKPPTYSWKFQTQAAYTDNTKQAAANLAQVSNKSKVYLMVKAVNTGNTTWSNSGINPVLYGAMSPQDRQSDFCDTSWISCNRPAALKEASVAPGQTGTFEFWANAPYATNGTTYKEYFRPLAEGKSWMEDVGQNWSFTMNSTDYAWAYSGQGVYTDSARTHAANLSALNKQTTYYVSLRAQNIGGQLWQTGKINLGTNNPQDRQSVFCDTSWIGCNRPASLKEASIAPGQTGTFEFTIKTPNALGDYKEYFRPVAEGVAWMNDLGQYWDFTITQ